MNFFPWILNNFSTNVVHSAQNCTPSEIKLGERESKVCIWCIAIEKGKSEADAFVCTVSTLYVTSSPPNSLTVVSKKRCGCFHHHHSIIFPNYTITTYSRSLIDQHFHSWNFPPDIKQSSGPQNAIAIAARCHAGARHWIGMVNFFLKIFDEMILIELHGWRQRMLQLRHGAMRVLASRQ